MVAVCLIWLTLLLAACGKQDQPTRAAAAVNPTAPVAPSPRAPRQIHLTGTVQAVRALTITSPQISGQGIRLILTRLIPNGSKVAEGDVLAEFDRVQQEDLAREAGAKYEDLGHQTDQKIAENRSEAEKRRSELQKAEADLAKANLQLQKGPLLNEIDRLKNETRAADARARVASLRTSRQHREQTEAAALRILELQRDRQKVALERTQNNLAKLVLKAPIGGMVALENIWRAGSMGPPQEGDQLWPGQALVRIFDPSNMQVQTAVAEPDGAALEPGVKAIVRLDAYPGLEFTARFESASPVAASAIGSPIKSFGARFVIEQTHPKLLPDLSAAVILQAREKP